MDNNSHYLNKQSSMQVSNAPCSTPNHTPKRGETSHLSFEQAFELMINFKKSGLLLVSLQDILVYLLLLLLFPHKSIKKKSTHIGVLVYLVEYLVITTL